MAPMSTHPFLTTAETRAAHLREIDQHMSALGMHEVRLADVQREIPELEAAMAVYRRLSDGAAPAAAAPRAKAPARRAPSRASSPAARPRRAPEPPSFKEFALTQLDSIAAGADAPPAPPGSQPAFA